MTLPQDDPAPPDPDLIFAYLCHECDDPCDSIGHDEIRFDPAPLLDRYRESHGRLDPIRIQLYARPDRSETVESLIEP